MPNISFSKALLLNHKVLLHSMNGMNKKASKTHYLPTSTRARVKH